MAARKPPRGTTPCPCCGRNARDLAKHLAQPECAVEEASQVMRELGWARAGTRASTLRAMGARLVEAPAYVLVHTTDLDEYGHELGKDSRGRWRYRSEKRVSRAWWAPRVVVEAHDLFTRVSISGRRPDAIRRALADPEWADAVRVVRRLGGAEGVRRLVLGLPKDPACSTRS